VALPDEPTAQVSLERKGRLLVATVDGEIEPLTAVMVEATREELMKERGNRALTTTAPHAKSRSTTERQNHMSRIAATFARLRAEGRTGLMPFVTVGYPELDAADEIVPALFRAGADIVELGIPFSDPIAEGPTIQQSSYQALLNGVTVQHCLDTARRLRARVDAPLIFMGYYNPLLAFGLDRFAAEAAAAGADGLIIPDVPPTESDDLQAACQRHGLDLIFLLAPTSTDSDIQEVARRASGFIYCLSVLGVTGARDSLSDELVDFLARVRAHADLPLAIGLGVSRAEHVERIGQIADAAIVGSALINRIDAAPPERRIQEVESFIAGLRPTPVMSNEQ
jgi:tryptophan synthase alpha chain